MFAEHGVDVTLRPLATGADVGRAVQSGQLDGGIVGTNGAVALRASGADIKAIFGFEVPSYLVASTDTSINSCKNLAGKTIAVDATGAPKDLALSVMLDSCGLSHHDVKTVNAGGPQSVDAVASGQVTVAVLHPDELAEVTKRTAKAPAVVVRDADVDPLSHYASFVTTGRELSDPTTRKNMVAVVAALHEAVQFINNPDNLGATAKIAAKMTGRDIDVTQAALRDFLALHFWPTDAGLSEEKIEGAIESEVKVGNVKEGKAPGYADMVDLTVYSSALEK
ncbi:ABC transporter substrate-binding protein [Nocardia sp. NPDC050630]|uniref:ABC transporter substrate-binding protein n=1 Tax=Nocardia sp. NPDC050630 TaxID=3364321 RepID=UPI0037B81DE9